MRQIGSVRDAAQARVFGDFLVARGIRNEVEREADGQWAVWIYEDDQLAVAQEWLVKFHAGADAPEFQGAAAEAERVRQAEADQLAAYRKRIRTRRSLFPRFGGYGVGVLTYLLILGSIVVSVLAGTLFSAQSRNQELSEFCRRVLITDPTAVGMHALPEVSKGEVWRLFTPIFIHFSPLHLGFNMLFLYQLGCMIEARQSTFRLAVLVVVIALCSNLAQYFVSARYSAGGVSVFVGAAATFGGMSGVLYGLAGYAWIRGKYDRGSGIYLDPSTVTILLAWLVFCFTGWAGPVANTAHVVGLAVGMVWGWLSAAFARGRPE